MNRHVLLLEPGYRNKYPPLGLMKIAAYHRERGDQVHFHKHGFGKLEKMGWDRVYVTTLFSFEWKRTAKAIDWSIGQVDGDRSVVSRNRSWGPHGNWSQCSVAGFTGKTEQSGSRLEPVPSPLS